MVEVVNSISIMQFKTGKRHIINLSTVLSGYDRQQDEQWALQTTATPLVVIWIQHNNIITGFDAITCCCIVKTLITIQFPVGIRGNISALPSPFTIL